MNDALGKEVKVGDIAIYATKEQVECESIPAEILVFVKWLTDEGMFEGLHYAAKKDIIRCEAWEQIRLQHSKDKVWRKAHTENYWVWYLREG